MYLYYIIGLVGKHSGASAGLEGLGLLVTEIMHYKMYYLCQHLYFMEGKQCWIYGGIWHHFDSMLLVVLLFSSCPLICSHDKIVVGYNLLRLILLSVVNKTLSKHFLIPITTRL